MSNQPAVVGPDGILRPYIGGQALIEGVMMRSPHAFAAVVRRQNGELVVLEEPMRDVRRGKLAWPLVRGVTALVEAMRLGFRALNFSAEVFENDLDEAEARAKKPPAPSTLAAMALPVIALVTNEPELPPSRESGEGSKKSPLMTALPIVFALTIFVALPQAFAQGISSLFGLDLDLRSFGFQGLTGAAKLVVVISVMMLMRQNRDIYRTFQYHGAEHKAIYTYESGEALTVENARKKTTLHPRCGTTFIVMVALVSILVFTGIGPFLPELGFGKLADNVLFFFMKLPFLPFIAALTFELQRFVARRSAMSPLRVLLWPGFLVQKVTTIQPDDQQLEVALGALAVTLDRERQPELQLAQKQSYPGYSELLARAAPAQA